MNYYITLLASFIVLSASLMSTAQGDDFAGVITHFKQPDGTKIKLRVIGNSNYARTEAMNGYTVVYNKKDQTYYYARLNKGKDGFIPTKYKADGKPPAGLRKHLKIKAEARRAKAAAKDMKLHLERHKRWNKRVRAAKARRDREKRQRELKKQLNNAGGEADSTRGVAAGESEPLAAPVTGHKVGLTILVQFPDDPETASVDPVNFPVSQNDIERFCNETGYSDNGNSGSVKDYFFDQSNGAMTYTMKVTQIVTLPHPRAFYNYSDYPANTTLRDSGHAGNRMITDAINELKSQNYDFSGLTIEGNEVRSTNIFFAGNDSGVWSEGLWPHAWGMYNMPRPQITVGGVTRYINEYQITNLASSQTRIGTFCHESGHLILDFPDLYDTNGGSSGLGTHCLMASGNWANNGRTPSSINLYLKSVVGWANITDLSPTEYRDVDLPSTGNVGYRIVNPNNSDEFFIIENRSDATGAAGRDKWAEYAPDKGIMVWHVDEAVHHNRDEQMTASQHYHVSLEQQDGDFDLENDLSADSQDLFDNNSLEFNDTNTPNANWWSGASSGIKLKVNSAPGSTMNVVFGTANTITVLSPNGGEKWATSASAEIKWYGSITGNVKIDLYKAGAFLKTLSANEANDGSYMWGIDNSLESSSDYSIKITSVDNGAISDDSDAPFSIAIESFVAGGVIPAGWTQSAGSNVGWVATSGEASEGQHSLRSGTVGDSQSSGVEKSAFTDSGTISFDVKVSSEENYDFLRFYIDGVEQDLNPSNSGERGLSGDTGWVSRSFPIPSGFHTFKWVYEKDEVATANQDAAWLDNVSFPENTDERIVIVSPNGGEKIDRSGVQTIEWISNTSVQGNVKIELYRGGMLLQTLAANEPDDGAYTWSLNNAYPVGNDYRIKITSNNNGALFDLSDGNFSIVDEIFVKGGVVPSGWVQSAGSTGSWVAVASVASEGQYSLGSESIGSDQAAQIEKTVTTNAGSMSFDIKVSSEENYDFVRFFIDGVERDLDENKQGVNGLSGDSGWLSKSFPVTAGEHTFKWSYEKDVSVSENDDRAYLDNVVIPELQLTGIALWKAQNFTGNDPAVTGNDADPDGDGIPNLMEYALGLDPNQRNANNGITIEKAENAMSLLYPKNTNATDISYEVQHSTDLRANSWSAANVAEQIIGTGSDVQYIKASMGIPASETKLFMRLKVELVP